MSNLKKPKWVDNALWMNLNEREKTYCCLRTRGLKEDEMREEMAFRCGRTWRYFQSGIRKKVFGK